MALSFLLLATAAVVGILGGPVSMWSSGVMFVAGTLARDEDKLVAAGAAGLGILLVGIPAMGFHGPAVPVIFSSGIAYTAGLTAGKKLWD